MQIHPVFFSSPGYPVAQSATHGVGRDLDLVVQHCGRRESEPFVERTRVLRGPRRLVKYRQILRIRRNQRWCLPAIAILPR